MRKKVNILLIGIAISLQPIITVIFKSFRLKQPEERINVILGFAGTGKSECLKMIKNKLENQYSKINYLGLWDMKKNLDSSPEEFIQNIKDKAKNVSGAKVLLLDNIDAWMRTRNQLSEGMSFGQWEKELVRALLYQSKDIFIVVTTSRQLFWTDPDVISNIRLHELRSPTLENMRNRAKKETTQIIEESYPLAFGYLWAMAELKRKPESKGFDIARSATLFVKEQIAENVRDILPEIAVAPLINIPLLRRLIKFDSGEITHGKSVELLDALLRSGLIVALSDFSAYRFTDGGIRRLLAYEYEQSNQVGFLERHTIAAEYFQFQSRYASSLHRTIVGAIYHSARKSSDPLRECQNWIQKNRENFEGADKRTVLEAWKTSDDDPHLKEELLQILGEDGFKSITKSLEIVLA